MLCKINPKRYLSGIDAGRGDALSDSGRVQKWEFVKTFETRMGTIRFDGNEQLSKEEADKRQQVLTILHPLYPFRIVAVNEVFNLL